MKTNYSILYAEDNNLQRESFISHLENYFTEVYEATNGKEALETYLTKKPDALLVDIKMPKINGFEVIKRIRQSDKSTPIIVLSGHSDKEYLFEAIKLNLIDYLVKPIDFRELSTAIESTIKRVDTNKDSEQERINISKLCYWDSKKRIVFYREKIVELTKNERMLFELLISKKNEIVQPMDIAEYVWSSKNDNVNDASIRNLVKRLRKKLPLDIVRSIYGSGYIMNF